MLLLLALFRFHVLLRLVTSELIHVEIQVPVKRQDYSLLRLLKIDP